MYAIRAQEGRGFRRDGVHFLSDKWTLVKEPTAAQLAEPNLIIVPTDAPDFDRKIGPLPISNPELLPQAPKAPAVAELLEANRKLTDENATLLAGMEATVRIVDSSTEAVSCLKAELVVRTTERDDARAIVQQITPERTQYLTERDEAIRERDAALAERDQAAMERDTALINLECSNTKLTEVEAERDKLRGDINHIVTGDRVDTPSEDEADPADTTPPAATTGKRGK